jgi:hypothetical protein
LNSRPEISARAQEASALLLLEQAMEYTYHAALRIAAQLGVADHLTDGPRTPEEIAVATRVQPQKIYRVLRLLATRGIFHEDAQGRFALTPAADSLRTDASLSVRHAILMLTDETLWRPVGELLESVRGHPAFKHIYGLPFFDYWAQKHVPADDFHVGMSCMSEVENTFLVRSYRFPENAVVADVAGGFGGLLLRVLKENPSTRGILFDQPHVLARHRLSELGDADRWCLIAGSFFETCPRADVYLFKYIMHDWPDSQAARILGCCRRAMPADARVLIMDPVIPEGNDPHPGKAMDLLCMAIYEGGRERKESEFRALLEAADLKLSRIIDTGCYVSIVEAIAA